MFTCRECEQAINQASEICPYCGADLTAPPAGESGQRVKKASVIRIIFLCGAALAILWAIAWFALPWRMAGSRPAAEAGAREALTRLQGSLNAYQASEGTFPRGLETLGDGARQAAQSAQSVHYTLLYTPGNPEADGRVKSYALVARAGNFGYLNFYTDESGVFRFTSEDRAATAQDPPLAPKM
ncbi:MAG: hypothetical protein WBP79_11010 [Candidatus Acidiferrales bacterium]